MSSLLYLSEYYNKAKHIPFKNKATRKPSMEGLTTYDQSQAVSLLKVFGPRAK